MDTQLKIRKTISRIQDDRRGLESARNEARLELLKKKGSEVIAVLFKFLREREKEHSSFSVDALWYYARLIKHCAAPQHQKAIEEILKHSYRYPHFQNYFNEIYLIEALKDFKGRPKEVKK